MKHLAGVVKGISSILDKLAAVCIFAVMVLVVANIILRTTLSRPIMGTYELVGFLTALGVSLALAHCALRDGHITVGFLVDRFPAKLQKVVGLMVNAIALSFWTMVTWYLFQYAHSMKLKGLVSSTAQIPVYPFIALIAIGLLALCLVFLVQLLSLITELAGSLSLVKATQPPKLTDLAKKAIR